MVLVGRSDGAAVESLQEGISCEPLVAMADTFHE